MPTWSWIVVLAKLQVERGERLVKKEHLRTVDEGARNRDALLLTAGELVRVLPRVLAHLDHSEYCIDLLLDFLLRELRKPQRERNVVPNRHRRKERVVLEHRVDAPLVWSEIRYVLALEEDAT